MDDGYVTEVRHRDRRLCGSANGRRYPDQHVEAHQQGEGKRPPQEGQPRS